MPEITQTTTEATTNQDNGKAEQRIGIVEDSQAQDDVTYYTHSFQGTRQLLPTEFAKTIESFESSIGMPVWLLLQRDEDEIDEQVAELFWKKREELPSQSPIALLIHSVGGYTECAFRLAKLLRHRCGSFIAIVPRLAKSAATLLALGGTDILLNDEAELGPLDAQIMDMDREEYASALDEVQTLERLQAFALDALDQTMMFLVARTGKKIETILPHATMFVAELTKPMFEKIDVVHYTQRARDVKVAEEYAIRLLRPRYSKDDAEQIARHLVEKYPEHGFVIDFDEPAHVEFKLQLKKPSAEQVNMLNSIVPYLGKQLILGRVYKEKTS
jgi:Serine dehydrogenase proteinase